MDKVNRNLFEDMANTFSYNSLDTLNTDIDQFEANNPYHQIVFSTEELFEYKIPSQNIDEEMMESVNNHIYYENYD